MTSVWLELTVGTVFEGGRERHTDEIYFNLTKEEADFFGTEPVVIRVDDGYYFAALASGHGGKGISSRHPKNLRSNPGTRFGEWLIDRKGFAPAQLVGTEVQFTDGGQGLFHARHAKQRAAG
jgi:hypothetical protein